MAGMTWFDDKTPSSETKFSAVSHSAHFGAGLQVRF